MNTQDSELKLQAYLDGELSGADQAEITNLLRADKGAQSLAAEMGAILGGATGEKVRYYAGFGHNVGLAFQVQDDILGIWGDERATGKSAASDLVEGKNSLPVLHGLAHSPGSLRILDPLCDPGVRSGFSKRYLSCRCPDRPLERRIITQVKGQVK